MCIQSWCATLIGLLVFPIYADHAVKDERTKNEGYRPNQAYLDQCAEGGNTSPQKGTVKNETAAKLYQEARRILANEEHQCATCHSPGTTNGSKNFSNILDRDELTSSGVINIEKPEDSSLLRQLKDDSMPIDGKALNAQEKAKLLEWIKAGAPNEEGLAAGELPVGFVSDQDKILCMEKDLRTVPKEDRAKIRYLDLTHLYNTGRNSADVEVAINRLINSLSWKEKLKTPVRVDKLGTLLRINLEDYGWGQHTWDLILKKNPYGLQFDTPHAKKVYERTQTTVPDIRGDWFVFAASKEPLYGDILGLNLDPTENHFKKIVRADLNPYRQKEERFRVGNRRSGVSNNNRAFNRVPTLYKDGYLYQSDDFQRSDGNQNIFEHPGDYKRNGGEYIASIPKKDEKGESMNAQVYGLFNENGKALPEVDANLGIVAHPARSRQAFRVANGVSCFDCHDRLADGIINPNRNELAEHLKKNPHLFDNAGDLKAQLEEYKTQEEIEPIYKRDQDSYRKFQDATGGRPGAIFRVANGFEEEMSERQVAAELAVTTRNFQKSRKRKPGAS